MSRTSKTHVSMGGGIAAAHYTGCIRNSDLGVSAFLAAAFANLTYGVTDVE